jgi:hypothetical protein
MLTKKINQLYDLVAACWQKQFGRAFDFDFKTIDPGVTGDYREIS